MEGDDVYAVARHRHAFAVYHNAGSLRIATEIHAEDGTWHAQVRQLRLHIRGERFRQRRAALRQHGGVRHQFRLNAGNFRRHLIHAFGVVGQLVQIRAFFFTVCQHRLYRFTILAFERTDEFQPFFHFLQPFGIKLHAVAVIGQLMADIGYLHGSRFQRSRQRFQVGVYARQRGEL
ncbi:MAG: hypothetical protein BWY76_02800 [bacterium ADurb.Bin429]|nr:MAG: hypothetical protein BWY76_02800 [bacterium ADurb.Bin429]